MRMCEACGADVGGTTERGVKSVRHRTTATVLRSRRAALLALQLVVIVVATAPGCDSRSSTSSDSSQTGGEQNRPDGAKWAAFKQQVTWERSEAYGIHHLYIHFVPTEGAWRPGEKLTFQVRLKQPCESWRISGGFDHLEEIIRGSKTNTTEINVSTLSVPKPGEHVVIDVQGNVPPEIDQVAMLPREPDPAAAP